MKRKPDLMPLLAILLAGICGLAAPRLAAAATASSLWVPEKGKERSVKLVLHPAAEPVPAMKYHLLPEFLDRLPGNAAVDYGKVSAEKQNTLGNSEWMKKNVLGRLDTPLESLRGVELDPVKKSQNADGELSVLFQTLEMAARRESCDWQLPIRTGRFYTLLIPEAQQNRTFARLLFVQARIQIANGQHDQAIKTLQSGYALARNAARAETLVHGLVGIAIASMMDDCVLEMAQQPGAPNLYWALTSLPRPLIETRQGIEAEADAVYLSWPALRDVATGRQGEEYWREVLLTVCKELEDVSGDRKDQRSESLLTKSLKGYPTAKERLIAAGMPAKQVEAMSAPQVVLLSSLRTYEKFRDESFKWFYVPYWQASERMVRAEREYDAAIAKQPELVPFTKMLLPGVRASRVALARSERANALLRLIEALRIYGAAHDGRLPDTLDNLTEVAIPIDPFTGKPFEYRREGDRAIIEGPPMPGLLLKLEVQMAKNGSR